MDKPTNVDLSWVAAKHPEPGLTSRLRMTLAGALLAILAALAALAPSPAHAVDGCKVLLCLAAPSWRSIPECVPTINQLHRDLARGKPFPVCSMAGAGNSANNTWASAPGYCPPQYTRVFDGECRVCDRAVHWLMVHDTAVRRSVSVLILGAFLFVMLDVVTDPVALLGERWFLYLRAWALPVCQSRSCSRQQCWGHV